LKYYVLSVTEEKLKKIKGEEKKNARVETNEEV
jgi:hypothetical protein